MSSPMAAPIYINLDGKFSAPNGAGKYVAGEISPDLRLETLDAFLQQLSSNMESKVTSGHTLAYALDAGFSSVLARAAKQMKALVPDAVECKLCIKVKVDPANNSMVYDFDIRVDAES